MEEDFYATIKLISGEEIFAKVSVSTENDSSVLLVNNPVVVSEIKTRRVNGYKVEPWIKTSNEDLFVLNMNNIITITENNNKEIIKMHDFFLQQVNIAKDSTDRVSTSKVSRRMGYLSTIEDAKNLLEKIYNDN